MHLTNSTIGPKLQISNQEIGNLINDRYNLYLMIRYTLVVDKYT